MPLHRCSFCLGEPGDKRCKGLMVCLRLGRRLDAVRWSRDDHVPAGSNCQLAAAGRLAGKNDAEGFGWHAKAAGGCKTGKCRDRYSAR